MRMCARLSSESCRCFVQSPCASVDTRDRSVLFRQHVLNSMRDVLQLVMRSTPTPRVNEVSFLVSAVPVTHDQSSTVPRDVGLFCQCLTRAAPPHCFHLSVDFLVHLSSSPRGHPPGGHGRDSTCTPREARALAHGLPKLRVFLSTSPSTFSFPSEHSGIAGLVSLVSVCLYLAGACFVPQPCFLLHLQHRQTILFHESHFHPIRDLRIEFQQLW